MQILLHQMHNPHRVKTIFTWWCFFCIGVLAPMQALSQAQAPAQGAPPAQPPARDTAFTQRTVVVTDSMPAPWRALGRLTASDRETETQITKLDMRKLQYGALADALYRGTHWTPLSHGGFGQNDGLSVMGGMNVDLAVSINTRPLTETWSGTYQLIQAQPAGLERVEILTGTDAVGLAPSMTLTAMNMQSMIHNSATPYTALWYHQGGGDIVAMDGTFSQNVAENFNVTVGVKRSGANGRYTNTSFDIWNLRAALRWTMSARSHLMVSYELASLNTGLWGGVRYAGLSSEFTEDAAPPVNFTLADNTRRHDITANFAQLLADDSTSVLTASLYGTYSAVRRYGDSANYGSTEDTLYGSLRTAAVLGAQLRYDQTIGVMRLRVGVLSDVTRRPVEMRGETVETYNMDYSNTQAFGHITFDLTPSLIFRGAARLALQDARFMIGAGAGLQLLTSDGHYSVDASTSERAPFETEGYALDAERHYLFSASGQWNTKNIRASATAYARFINDPIVAVGVSNNGVYTSATSSNASSRMILGVAADATWRVGDIEVRPVVRVTRSTTADVEDQRFPLMMGDLSVAYVYEVGRNSVRLGVSGRWLSTATLPQYVAPSWTYAEPTMKSGDQYDGLNVFLMAIVGNATVRASYENILGQRWYTTSYAPEITRAIRLSVDWSFFD